MHLDIVQESFEIVPLSRGISAVFHFLTVFLMHFFRARKANSYTDMLRQGATVGGRLQPGGTREAFSLQDAVCGLEVTGQAPRPPLRARGMGGVDPGNPISGVFVKRRLPRAQPLLLQRGIGKAEQGRQARVKCASVRGRQRQSGGRLAAENGEGT